MKRAIQLSISLAAGVVLTAPTLGLFIVWALAFDNVGGDNLYLKAYNIGASCLIVTTLCINVWWMYRGMTGTKMGWRDFAPVVVPILLALPLVLVSVISSVAQHFPKAR
jgi:hypothetical protein